MFFDMFGQFATGAAAGLGHTFGISFLPWVTACWRWLWHRPTATPVIPPSQSLIRRVTIDELSAGIPEGYQVCRYQGDQLVDKFVTQVPEQLQPGETLWLVPTNSVVVSAGFSDGDASTNAEVAIEFCPEEGLSSLLTDGQELNRGWLEGLIAGGWIGVATSLGRLGALAFKKGEAATVEDCRQQLNSTFKNRGIRVTSLRALGALPAEPEAPAEDQPAVPAELTRQIENVRTRDDWDRLVQSLRTAGVPIDAQTTSELDALRDRILARTIEPNRAVTGLARLTAEAFEKAGIGQPDLQRWQTISDRLADVDPAAPEDQPALAAVGVVTTKRPSTWLVWSRIEVDQRLLRYIRQSVRHCRGACDQALMSLRDMPSLRQIRDLNEQLKLIEELLATVPPLQPKTASLRLDGAAVKTLLRSLEEGVLTTEKLSREMDGLFAHVPASEAWNRGIHSSLQQTSRLAQLVRDRRAVR